jgi:hypothetical protein
LDTLRFRRDPSIIWNAIPFTFVVDWFVNVANYLEQFAVDNLGIKVEIVDFCSSVKQSIRADSYMAHWENTGSGPFRIGAERQYQSAALTAYERRTMLPNLGHALTLSGLSVNEAYLSAALIGANIKRN